jgi:hypothetical protein
MNDLPPLWLRLGLAATSFLVALLFANLFALLLFDGGLLASLLPPAVALYAAVYAWRKPGWLTRSRPCRVLMYALVFGGIGFIAGFFGPIYLAPEANQGPLLGIFITGPGGFLFGLLYGLIKSRTA